MSSSSVDEIFRIYEPQPYSFGLDDNQWQPLELGKCEGQALTIGSNRYGASLRKMVKVGSLPHMKSG